MKKAILLFLSYSSFSILSSQTFFQGLGVGYMSNSGTFNNYSFVSLNYNPQFVRENGNVGIGLAFPMSLGKKISAERENSKKGLLIELPVSFELTFKPSPFQSSSKNFSIFAGAGVSKVYYNSFSSASSNYINLYTGVRIPPFGRSLELRMTYSRGTTFSDQERIGLSLSYLFD